MCNLTCNLTAHFLRYGPGDVYGLTSLRKSYSLALRNQASPHSSTSSNDLLFQISHSHSDDSSKAFFLLSCGKSKPTSENTKSPLWGAVGAKKKTWFSVFSVV